jgi:oxygen-independent coproporphyrinogen-3 oxidase
MLGVYISVPFCRTKCSYCNFASGVFSKSAYEGYVRQVIEDISNARTTASQLGCDLADAVDSIYLGGGTPPVLESSQLERLFETVRSDFSVLPSAEITVECAPGSLTPSLIDILCRCGVNRVSLGVQSFVDHEAAAVGRLHQRATVIEEIARLRQAGISKINIDLIAGLPHQTAESWDFSLNETIATGAPHVSVYMLEIDEDSRLGRELIAGGTRYHAHFVPDDEAVADFYVRGCEVLDAVGIAQYEISNFARSGGEARHNLKYWTRQPYIGFGVDAHSMLECHDPSLARMHEPGVTSLEGDVLKGLGFSRAAENSTHCHPEPSAGEFASRGRARDLQFQPVPAIRFSTPDSLDRYLNRGPLQVTLVSPQASLEECFFLGLRLNRGVDLDRLRNPFDPDWIVDYESEINDCVNHGLLERRGAIIRLTTRGRLLSNEVFARFIRDREAPAVQDGERRSWL